jgi:hypothetical protein
MSIYPRHLDGTLRSFFTNGSKIYGKMNFPAHVAIYSFNLSRIWLKNFVILVSIISKKKMLITSVRAIYASFSIFDIVV